MGLLHTTLPVIQAPSGLQWHTTDLDGARLLQGQYDQGSELFRFLLRAKSGARPLNPEERQQAIGLLNRTPIRLGSCGESEKHLSIVGGTGLCYDCCADILGRS